MKHSALTDSGITVRTVSLVFHLTQSSNWDWKYFISTHQRCFRCSVSWAGSSLELVMISPIKSCGVCGNWTRLHCFHMGWGTGRYCLPATSPQFGRMTAPHSTCNRRAIWGPTFLHLSSSLTWFVSQAWTSNTAPLNGLLGSHGSQKTSAVDEDGPFHIQTELLQSGICGRTQSGLLCALMPRSRIASRLSSEPQHKTPA